MECCSKDLQHRCKVSETALVPIPVDVLAQYQPLKAEDLQLRVVTSRAIDRCNPSFVLSCFISLSATRLKQVFSSGSVFLDNPKSTSHNLGESQFVINLEDTSKCVTAG